MKVMELFINEQTSLLLFNGDVIFIMGLRIVVVGKNNFFINNPFNRVTYIFENKLEIEKKKTE